MKDAGKEVYLDIQGWHLFLKDVTVSSDVKMHQVSAHAYHSLPGPPQDLPDERAPVGAIHVGWGTSMVSSAMLQICPFTMP